MCQQTIVGVALKRCGPLESLVHGNRARQSSGEDGWKRAQYRVTRWPSILQRDLLESVVEEGPRMARTLWVKPDCLNPNLDLVKVTTHRKNA